MVVKYHIVKLLFKIVKMEFIDKSLQNEIQHYDILLELKVSTVNATTLLRSQIKMELIWNDLVFTLNFDSMFY